MCRKSTEEAIRSAPAERIGYVKLAVNVLGSELESAELSGRIRVHYCYGNWSGPHRFDADFRRILPELLRLKAGTLVGEMANPRHEGDALILREYLEEHEWPRGMKLAAGVIDVKTLIVETPDTVAIRLKFLASLDKLGPDRVLGGTDCGFETFAGMDNVPKIVGLQKLKSLSEGAAQASG